MPRRRHCPLSAELRRAAALLAVCGSTGACSDYGFKSQADGSAAGDLVDTGEDAPSEPSGAPLAVVSPSVVDLGVVCGVGTSEVIVENQGDADLNVTSVDTNHPDWSAAHDALPKMLAPGDTLAISLRGEPVDTELLIETDDPANPELRVPLSGTPDAPPTVSITDPAAGSVLEPPGSHEFLPVG